MTAPLPSRLTPAQLAGLRHELASTTLIGFMFATSPTYQMGWVHAEICGELENFLAAVRRKESPRLLLTMPPRHGKSEIASRRFPACLLVVWVVGRVPT